MCEPMTILTIVSAVASVASQSAQADAQNSANNRQYKAAVTARSENANQVSISRSQETDDAGAKINANNLALREAQGTALAKAGPGGLSMDALLGSMAQKGAGYNASVTQNLERVNSALDQQLVNVNRGAASTINSLQTPAMPDYFGTALKIGNTLNTAGHLG